MNDYIKIDKKRKRKGNVLKMLLLLFVFVIVILLYDRYSKIDISKTPSTQNNATIERMSQTIEEAEEENKTISQLIEEANKSVVGISKVKEIGDTIFLEDTVSNLGLGTGLIVSENGYILTNEHVSRAKIFYLLYHLKHREKL